MSIKQLENLLRDNIRRLKAYSSARDEYSGKDGIFLDANENSFDSVPSGNLNRYPDPFQSDLKDQLSKIHSIDPNQIFVGNGSDEAIDLLLRAFCNPQKDSIMIMPPTYGMYQVAADINDVETQSIALTADFEIDTSSVLSAIKPTTKIIFICSPNNPTGNTLNREAIESILLQFPGIVVVDEAYVDFSPHPSWLSRLSEFQNLVVLQTFSKAWGLAGMRCGMAFANPFVVSILNKIKYPYNVNGVTQAVASEAVRQLSQKESLVQKILEQKEWLINQLKPLPFVEHIYASDTNFLLIKVSDATKLYDYLVSFNIIIRNRTTVLHCGDCVRITVGTPSENEVLVEKLKLFKE
jgi:histidinol-phosphate aminotransferase